MNGDKTGTMELNDSIFNIEVNEHVVHQAVVQYLANRRQGTKSAKTRAEVRGGGRKPWRQKGTGRARQGSIRAPQWTGGGVVFAPKPRDYSFKLNKKVKRLALKSVLSDRCKNDKIMILEELKFDQIKTKQATALVSKLGLKKALIVMDGTENRNVILSVRNVPDIKTAAVNTINPYDILKYDTFVATKDAINKIQEVYV